MAKDIEQAKAEFSRIVNLEDISSKTHSISIKAEDAECEALAKRFGFEKISDLEAKFIIEWLNSTSIVLKGKAQAKIKTKVGKESVEFTLTEEIDEEFTTKEDIESQDLYGPESITDGKLDIGEITAQYIYLAAQDYLANQEQDALEHREEKPSPFSKLKDLL